VSAGEAFRLLGLAALVSVARAPLRAFAQDTSPAVAPPQARALEPDQVEIEYVAHACFRLRSPGGKRILIDPFASRVWLGYDFPAGLAADAVLITHPHYDHDGGRRIGRDVSWMKELTVLDQPGEHELGDVRVRGIRGKHADPWGKEFGQLNTIWLVEVAGLRIAHLGDNGPLSAAAVEELGRVDVLMLPVDSEEHILKLPEIEAIRAALKPRVLVPMHYRLPDLEPEPGQPEKLGPIDPWLEGRANVRRLDGHVAVLSATRLPETEQIFAFRHSPAVVPTR
jgi:L-ascorbate metabolism protein UlaG (beta-lactamase superfamily)